MASLPIGDFELYYESHGEGPALVFAHGAGGNHLSWYRQVAAFSPHFQCVSFDHRTFGFSRDLPQGPGPSAYVEDLRALLDHLRIERATLVAQSMGGLTALGFAAAYPQRVRGLMLCDTPAGVDDPAIRRATPPRQAGDSDLDTILRRAVARDFPQRDPTGYFLYREVTGLNRHVPADLLPRLFAVKNSPEPVVTHRIPTVLVVGEEDLLTPPALMEALAARFPHAHLHRVPGAGHSVYWETPAEFNRLLADFLASLAG